MLQKVISGGQTGADIAGLRAARDAGIKTGGWIPKGFLTELGPTPDRAEFGLVETTSSEYPPRTEHNVRDSDATFWFGNTWSPGYALTSRMCMRHAKPLYLNFTSSEIVTRIQFGNFSVINIAGNRESKNPGMEIYLYRLLLDAFIRLPRCEE